MKGRAPSSGDSIGPLIADVAGLELTAEDREVLKHPLIGGVIFFARNYRDRDQLRALCDDILGLRSPRLLLTTDHEGGRVQRFRDGFTKIPPMRSLGRRYETDRPGALDEAQQIGATIGRELGEFGIDLCFAPVLDLDIGVSGVIGDRALAGDPQTIVDLARAFRTGLNSAGMAATIKHFPGHGSVALDSHKGLPVDPRPLDEIERTDLAPFRALIADQVDSVMMAHVRFTQVDEMPSSLSKRWVDGYLRGTLGFKGPVFTDDLSMGGAAVMGGPGERARLALEAGCDMLPLCNDRAAVVQALDHLKNVKPSAESSARLRGLFREHR